MRILKHLRLPEPDKELSLIEKFSKWWNGGLVATKKADFDKMKLRFQFRKDLPDVVLDAWPSINFGKEVTPELLEKTESYLKTLIKRWPTLPS